jgi:hypothetical protein
MVVRLSRTGAGVDTNDDVIRMPRGRAGASVDPGRVVVEGSPTVRR